MLSDFGVLALGLVILVAGYLIPLGVLITVGWIITVIGLVLLVLGLTGRSVFRSRHRRF